MILFPVLLPLSLFGLNITIVCFLFCEMLTRFEVRKSLDNKIPRRQSKDFNIVLEKSL
jgi:hypothetical protein